MTRADIGRVRAQQLDRVRHIGMLNALGQDDPEAKARIAVFEQTLQQLGWMVGRNLKIEIRQIGDGDGDRLRSYSAEMVALAPYVIFSIGSVAVALLQEATRTIPIVFVNAPDPVGAGIVQSLADVAGGAAEVGFLTQSGQRPSQLRRLQDRTRLIYKRSRRSFGTMVTSHRTGVQELSSLTDLTTPLTVARPNVSVAAWPRY
jgi:hypothetical protein